MEKGYTGNDSIKNKNKKVIVYPIIMVFKRGKNRLTVVGCINSSNVRIHLPLYLTSDRL